MVAYADTHSAIIKPILDAFPDPRQVVLDRWEESGEKLPPHTGPVARFDWMREQYGYSPEEVQNNWHRQAGWVYKIVHAQRVKENYQRQKEKASKKD